MIRAFFNFDDDTDEIIKIPEDEDSKEHFITWLKYWPKVEAKR